MGYQRQQIAKVCGRDFKGNSKQKYCSRECARRRQRAPLAALAAYRRTCPHCGGQLWPMSGKRRLRNGAGDLTPCSQGGEDGRAKAAAPTAAGVNGDGLSVPPAGIA
jgi:hypothetical protein